jgi:RND family efflux transporter MFP subunit
MARPLRNYGIGLSLLAASCSQASSDPHKAAPAASVTKPVKESDLATIHLAPDAEARLAIKTAPAARRTVARARLFGGEVVALPGASVTVSAPVSGALAAPPGTNLPMPGEAVAAGQVVFSLALTPQERVRFAGDRASLAASKAEAQAAIDKAKVEVEAASIALARAEKLLADRVGSAEALDDAKAQSRLAEAALRAAEARRASLAAAMGSEAGSSAPLPIPSPMSGLLLAMTALPGQVVAAGAPLFEVARQDPVRVKVPIYVGDLGLVDLGADASVGGLGAAGHTAPRAARPVTAPPSASARAATVDVQYELANADGALRLGQRVFVTVPIRDEEESLAVPWASVLHDYHGGTWVYERTAPETYARRRVVVRHVVGDVAALEIGPRPGAEIVTDGAAELFGVELGTGK